MVCDGVLRLSKNSRCVFVTTKTSSVRMVAIEREIQRTNPSLHKELFGAGERTSDCSNDWRRIGKSHDEKSLRRFLQVCSQSQFAGLAQLRLDCQYATLLETELWKQVVRQHELAQYDLFLTCYPSGDFSVLARLKRTSSK